MTTKYIIPSDISDLYEIHEWRNAAGVLKTAHPEEFDEVLVALREFKLLRSEILVGGGRKSLIADRIDNKLLQFGWIEKKFDVTISIDDHSFDTPTHKIDCYKNRVALEVEWNNKDPFFDRDLNNFRLLFDLNAIDLGIIVTRSSSLQEIFNDLNKGSSYGQSTTHINKLIPRIDGGGGGGCPVLVFGIGKGLYQVDEGKNE